MKKIIAMLLSVVMMFSCLGIVASAARVPACKPVCPTKPVCAPAKPVKPTCPAKPECTTKEECTTIVNNNTNITIMPEEDPTTVLGFLYRVIKTVLPYLYKFASMFSIEISFGADNAACDKCNSKKGCSCDDKFNGNGNTIIVVPSKPSVDEPAGDVNTDSDSADSDSDSIDSILGSLFGDLFA